MYDCNDAKENTLNPHENKEVRISGNGENRTVLGEITRRTTRYDPVYTDQILSHMMSVQQKYRAKLGYMQKMSRINERSRQ
jgi:hypothetical protein